VSEVKIPAGQVLVEDRGSVRILRLSRPGRLNSFGTDLGSSLVAALNDVTADPAVHAVVVTGDGDRAFSSGADLGDPKAHSRTVGGSLAASHMGMHPTFGTLVEFGKPIVAAINGYAIGAGFLMTLCCDVLVASPTAQFALPQVSLGILPSFAGIGRLAQWIGRGRALEIALTGRRVGAEEAAAIGLVSKVSENYLEDACALAEQLGSLPPLAVKMAKESVYLSLEVGSLRMGAATDVYRSACLQQTSDTREAHQAWKEKRTPVYTGE
jgi:enoyl-CoA hydratase/carnithine racemase